MIEFKEKIEIYKNQIGLVYSKCLNDFWNEIRSNIHISSPISIRKNKIYFLLDNKIVGPDLNIYLEDLKEIYKEDKYSIENNNDILKPIKFTNIEGKLILLDNNNNILLAPKNFSKIIFKAKAIDYVYSESNKILIILYNSVLTVYKEPDVKIKPFKLIEENIMYSEQEDEFDESNSEIRMF